MKIGIGLLVLAMALTACTDDTITDSGLGLSPKRGEDWLPGAFG